MLMLFNVNSSMRFADVMKWSVNCATLRRKSARMEFQCWDTGESPEAPQPREMIDLEVRGRNNNIIHALKYVYVFKINALLNGK
jgi:hypothetical protein